MRPKFRLLVLRLSLFDISVLIMHIMIPHYTFILIRSIVCLINFFQNASENIIPTVLRYKTE